MAVVGGFLPTVVIAHHQDDVAGGAASEVKGTQTAGRCFMVIVCGV